MLKFLKNLKLKVYYKLRLKQSMDSSKTENLNNQTKEELLNKIKGCIFGQFIGDSLAMPVHWYYDINQFKRDFGKLTKYEAPKANFPNSILNLSNTDGPGRGSDKGNLIGEVILHGKKKFWQRGKSYHYHHGMKAGENTLDTLLIRVLYRNMIKNQTYSEKGFLEDFIKFMTTPDTHNDVYASSSLRIFFKNWSLGIPVEDCPGNDSHNVDSIDSIVIITPVIISNLFSDETKRNSEIRSSILCTRKAIECVDYAILYGDLLTKVLLKQSNIRDAVCEIGKKLGLDIKKDVENYRGKEDPMTACYIDSSFSVLLFYAYKYADDPEKMLLASANGCGENVGRGSLLGALVGAEFGFSKFPKNLVDDLVDKESILKETDEFINTFCKF